MPLQKGRLKTYLIPHAFLQGHFENSKEMNGSVFFFFFFFFFFLICWVVQHLSGGCEEEQLAFFKILDGPSLWDRSISQKCNSSAMTVWGYFSSNPLSRLRGCPHHIPRPLFPLSFTLFLLSLQVWIHVQLFFLNKYSIFQHPVQWFLLILAFPVIVPSMIISSIGAQSVSQGNYWWTINSCWIKFSLDPREVKVKKELKWWGILWSGYIQQWLFLNSIELNSAVTLTTLLCYIFYNKEPNLWLKINSLRLKTLISFFTLIPVKFLSVNFLYNQYSLWTNWSSKSMFISISFVEKNYL